MSFVWKAAQRLKSPEQVAAEVLEVARSRGLDELAAVLAVMCIAQESDFWCPWNAADPSSGNYPYDSKSNDGRSVGYFQQQNGRAGDTLPAGDRDNWWGPMSQRMDLKRSCNEFLARLEGNYHEAANNPSLASNHFISNVQGPREDLRGEYAKHWDRAWQLVRGAAGGGTPPAPTQPESGPWTGDPIWLADVLRAEGVTVIECELNGIRWNERGHGDMGSLWGVVNHHTGSNNSTWQSIWNGRPDLAGPLAHIHLRRDGVAELVAVGVCWHAGTGAYADLGRGMGNQRTIGIECQNDGGGSPGKPHRSSWPDAQYNALVKCNAAIDRRLAVGASHSISHQEYDDGDPGTDEGKWDPGAIDMDIFRADVQQQINAQPGGNDDMAQVPQDQWDRFYREWTEVMESLSIYATPGEGPVATLKRFVQIADKFGHEADVEKNARLGDEDAVTRIVRTALGQGKFTDEAAVTRAGRVLDEIAPNWRNQLPEGQK